MDPCPAALALFLADSDTVLFPELFFAAVFFVLFLDVLFLDVLLFFAAVLLSAESEVSSYPRYFSSSEADMTVVSAFWTDSVFASEPCAFIPENTSAAMTAAAGISFGQGTLGVPFSAGFLSFKSFSIIFSPLFFMRLLSGICSFGRFRSFSEPPQKMSRPLPQIFPYTCGRGSYSFMNRCII